MFRKQSISSACSRSPLLLGPQGLAHPMGNFSVNHYSKISLDSDGIKISYIIDLAEIPTYQELQQGNVTADVADPAVTRFVAQRGAELDGTQSPGRWQTSAAAACLQPGDFSSRSRRPAHHEDGLVYKAAYPPLVIKLRQFPPLRYALVGMTSLLGTTERSQVRQPAVRRRQFSRPCRMEGDCGRCNSGGQFHQQLSAADGSQRWVNQLPYRPA